MTAVHPFQYSVIEGLDSHTETVHSQIHESCDISLTFLHYIFRIDFKGKLFKRSPDPLMCQILNQ